MRDRRPTTSCCSGRARFRRLLHRASHHHAPSRPSASQKGRPGKHWRVARAHNCGSGGLYVPQLVQARSTIRRRQRLLLRYRAAECNPALVCCCFRTALAAN